MKKEAAAVPAMDFKLASSMTGPFTAIARAMSGQWGINVIPNGFRCETDGKKNIWIPFAADHLGEEARRALHGMLDHEVCHVVEETEHEKALRPTPVDILRGVRNKTVRMLLNVVEDIRIERKWSARYPGVSQNLMECHLHVMEINKRDWGKAKRSFWDSFGLLLFTKARGVDGDMSWVGEKAATALAECEDELKALDHLEWVQDSYDLAERIWTKINRDAEETLDRASKAKKKPAEKPKSKKEDEKPAEKPEPGDEGEPSEAGEPGGESGEEAKGEESAADEGGRKAKAPKKEADDEDDLDGEESDDEDLDGDAEEGDDDSEAADAGDDSDDESDASDDEDGEGAGGGSDDGDEADEADEDEASGTGSDESDEDLDGESEDDDDAGGAGGAGDGPSDEDIEAAKEILAGSKDDEDGGEEGDAGPSVPVAGSGSGESEDETPPTPEEVARAREILESVAGIEDFVRTLADELEKEARADARKHKLYIPDPAMRKLDRWFKPEGGTLENYMAAKADVDSQIGAIRGKQLAFIQTITRKRLITGQDAGLLDAAALSTVRTGSLDVFADIKKGIALDTAIEVLLDLSGSMGPGDAVRDGVLSSSRGGRYPAYYCKRIAIALAEAWEPLRIPNEFIGFSNEHGRMSGPADPDAVRRAPFDFHVFKAWGERLKNCRERFSTICGHWDNADGEAVMAAAQRLAMRPEKRKLLVVISDGYPCHGGISEDVLNKHLKETVRKIARTGMEVLGVGAGTEAPSRFYNKETGAKHLIIKDLNTLAPRLFATLRESILK